MTEGERGPPDEPPAGRPSRGGPPWRGGAPPWWPQSEPWPPRGRGGWEGVPRHFVRRIVQFLLALFGLASLAGGFLFWLGTRFGGTGEHRWAGPPFGFGFFVVVVVF